MSDDTRPVVPYKRDAPRDGLPKPTNAVGKPGQCTANRRDGQRCTRWSIAGATVCTMHGGQLPRVKDRARLRLAALAEPAIATLAREMTQAASERARIAAANSILDRSGYGRTMKVESEEARELLIDLLIQQVTDGGK